MATYAMIMLDPSGDTFAVCEQSDGRVFGCGPLNFDEQEFPLEDYAYDEEWNAEAWSLGIASQDLESELPAGDRFHVIRTA